MSAMFWFSKLNVIARPEPSEPDSNDVGFVGDGAEGGHGTVDVDMVQLQCRYTTGIFQTQPPTTVTSCVVVVVVLVAIASAGNITRSEATGNTSSSVRFA